MGRPNKAGKRPSEADNRPREAGKRPGKADKRQVTLKVSPHLYEELERYARYLNLRVGDAAELAITNMVSQAKALGADWPVTRPWMDDEFTTWLEARDEFLREPGRDDE